MALVANVVFCIDGENLISVHIEKSFSGLYDRTQELMQRLPAARLTIYLYVYGELTDITYVQGTIFKCSAWQ